MLKLTTVASVVALTLADANHPVNEDIVKEIKEKTDLWEPVEPSENPFKDMTNKEVYGLLGTIYRPAYGDR